MSVAKVPMSVAKVPMSVAKVPMSVAKVPMSVAIFQKTGDEINKKYKQIHELLPVDAHFIAPRRLAALSVWRHKHGNATSRRILK
jgi:hypothetical protein